MPSRSSCPPRIGRPRDDHAAAPLAIVPLNVPPSVPAPEALLNCTVVALVTVCGLPSASCACTVTLNGNFAGGRTGTDVNASFVGKVKLNTLVAQDSVGRVGGEKGEVVGPCFVLIASPVAV